MSLDLDAIEQRAAAATPGPWWVVRDNADGFYGEDAYNVHGGENVAIAQGGPVEDGGPDVGACDRADAEFIAHAREDVPALVAEVKRLHADVRWANERSERLAARLVETRRALLVGGQTAAIRCQQAIVALDGAS